MYQEKQNFGEPIDRLLRSYEVGMQVFAFLIEIFTKEQSTEFTSPYWNQIKNGPAKHWQDIRKALLKIHTEGFDVEKYVGPTGDSDSKDLRGLAFTPYRLNALRVAEWTKSSRRVYRVPNDLGLLLAATSLAGVDWSMIMWPFDSLLISLEKPLVFRGKALYAILVTKDIFYDQEVMSIIPVSNDLPTMESVFVGNQRSRIEKALKKGDDTSLNYAREKLFSAIQNRIAGNTNSSFTYLTGKTFFEPGGLASRFEGSDFAEAVCADGFGDAEEVAFSKALFRIVFGLMLYLQSRPTKELIPKGWQPQKFERQEGTNRLIKLLSEVCMVKSVYSMTDEEREELEPILRGGYARKGVSTHHREGHWRRPWGKGHDPNHPKTVQILPLIVKRSKLANGGLPIGSTKIV